MTTTWIIVANASEARIFSSPRARLVNSPTDLDLVKEINHPNSRKKSGELVADKSGAYQGGDSGHGAFVEPSDPKDIEVERFAKELARELEDGRVANHFQDLIIAASPHFHGMLNKQLTNNVSGLVSVNIERDYTNDSVKELLKHIESFI